MRSLAASLLARPCSAAAAARAISSASSGPSVGATFRLTRAFSQEEVDTFVRLTGDANPLHSSAAAGPAGAPPPLVPGLLTGSLFAAIVGTHLPGALYLSQTLRFAAPLLVRPAGRWAGNPLGRADAAVPGYCIVFRARRGGCARE
jgi:hypothetical protein